MDGKDASDLYSDPDALGNIYVGPYLQLEPDLAFVLEDANGVGGYVLGTADSERFYHRYQQEWLPELRKRYPEPKGSSIEGSPTQKIYRQYYHPEILLPESWKCYPAHLHIDLLPRLQGKGWGKKMIHLLLEHLTLRGVEGVHLGVSANNRRAIEFYEKLGFQKLEERGTGGVDSTVVFYGKRLPDSGALNHRNC